MALFDWIKSQLKTTGEFKRVIRLAALSQVSQIKSLSETTVFVIDAAGTNQPNQRDIGTPIQEEKKLIAVVIAIKSTNDAAGEKAAAKLDAARLKVRQSLFGQSPQGYEQFVLAGHELIDSDGSFFFWVERFSTTHLISEGNLL